VARYKKISQPVGVPKGVKILRQLNPFAYKTTQGGMSPRFGTSVAKSKHDPEVLLKVTRQKGKVKVLHVVDPYNINSTTGIRATGATVATFSPEADHITNNPNPKYDPSLQPSANVPEFTARDVKVEVAGKASRGHQNVVKRTLFNQNQGKRLRRV
jgi:hypothetical protein